MFHQWIPILDGVGREQSDHTKQWCPCQDDESKRNTDWYGVIKKIISVQFLGGKEVMMFQCDWFDVPAPSKNKGTGYSEDQYGIIDIVTACLTYSDDPYIMATQAEQVFYVNHTKKSNWCSIVRIKPRNLFSMPE